MFNFALPSLLIENVGVNFIRVMFCASFQLDTVKLNEVLYVLSSLWTVYYVYMYFRTFFCVAAMLFSVSFIVYYLNLRSSKVVQNFDSII